MVRISWIYHLLQRMNGTCQKKQGRSGGEASQGSLPHPAGVLIGLGVGLLLNQPGPGVLIGLGLGFVGSAFLSSTGPSQDTPAPPPMYGPRWIPVVIGAFIILLGLWIAWGPPLPWTYFIAFVFILIGIGFIARGLGRMR